MRLKGQKIWVTGSGKRVGKAIAIACAREGADVVVHYRGSREGAEDTVAQVEKLGRKALLVQGDHGVSDDVNRMVSEIEEGFGSLTALVNCAAAFPEKSFEDISEEEFFDIVRINSFGPFLCAQKALPLLRKSTLGRIVNITDWAVNRPYEGYAHYMVSKGGLSTLTKALARELAPNILVNAIAPGPVLEPPNMSKDKRQRIIEKIPVGRWGTPESVVLAVLMLLENDNITGQEIAVDGGRTIG